MLLRASSEISGTRVDLHAVTEAEAAAASGVAHAASLVAFADAAVRGDDETLAGARDELLEKVGPEGLVDAAAVVGNFQRMVRIADSTGIPLDAPMHLITEDLRAELGIDRYASADNTPVAGPAKRALGRGLRPLSVPALKLFLDLRRRFRGRATSLGDP
jgi:hypothetical protein